MRGILNAARSVLSLLAILFWLVVPGELWLRLVVTPAIWLRPGRRIPLAAFYVKTMARILTTLLELGGARFEPRGRLPTDEPILVLMNHQSLADILTACLMATAQPPAFVTRSRYAGWIPSVSAAVRLFGCPVIDPHGDAKGALTTIEETMRARGGSVLIFPEGHRSRDGEIQAFKLGGALAALRARRTPVYLVVTDGVGANRRLVDFALNLHHIRSHSEVLGPFEPPEAEAEWPAFLTGLRQRMVDRLQEMRAGHPSL